jgi:2,5-diketo-D-gluconate reductase B
MIKKQNIPVIGLGTYPLVGEACTKAVENGLKVGYRHIDTAAIYNNEGEVGAAIKQSGIDRSELFITTKVWYTELEPAKLKKSAEESLRKLKTDHVNLLLIHWPAPDMELEATLEALMEVQSQGKAEHIGVSNFPPSLFKKACMFAPIYTNQVEYHPYLRDERLIAIAEEYNVMITAYSPLAKGKVLQEKILVALGQKYNKKPAQVCLKWLIQQPKVITIPKATTDEHQRINLDIFDFELTPDEMEEIDRLNRGKRVVRPAWNLDWEN